MNKDAVGWSGSAPAAFSFASAAVSGNVNRTACRRLLVCAERVGKVSSSVSERALTTSAPTSTTTTTPTTTAKVGSAICTTRRQALAAMVSAVMVGATLPVDRAQAFCGEEDPFWAHYVDWKEEFLHVTLPDGTRSSKILVRGLGNAKKEKAAKVLPVIFIADVSLPHEYLEPLEALAETQRRVFFYDQLGTGSSDPVPASVHTLDPVQVGMAQVSAILERYKLPRAHLFGHGFGGAVALALADAQPQRVASLILESPTFSYSPRELTDVRRLLQTSASKALPICAAEALDGAAKQNTLQQSVKFIAASSSRQSSALIPTYVLQPTGDSLSKESVAFLQRSPENSVEKLDSDEHSPHLYSANREQVVYFSNSFLEQVENKERKG